MSQSQACTLITGANGGLGQYFVQHAANETKQPLLLVGRNREELQKIITDNNLEARAHTIVADLSETKASVNKIAEFLKTHDLWVETIINNAGFGLLGSFVDTDGEKEQAMIAVNIATLTALTKLVLPQMKEHNQGKILNVASVASFFPGPYMAVYYATKAYVLSLTLALREELSQTNIHVTTLCPGPTKTGFSKLAEAENAGPFRGKLASAEEVADFGWRSLQNNTAVAIYNWRNVILVRISRFIPLVFITRVIGKAQKPA